MCRQNWIIIIFFFSENYQKIATSNVIFSRTADRIAAKFCIIITRSSPMSYIKIVFILLAH